MIRRLEFEPVTIYIVGCTIAWTSAFQPGIPYSQRTPDLKPRVYHCES